MQGAEMTTEVANEVSFTLKDFLNEFKDEIKNKILDKLDPVYNPNNLSEWEKQKALELNKLLRKPFEVQKHSILALAKGFYKKDKKSLILTAEMGTGKTLMSIAVANLNPKINKRTLVVCPPHLAENGLEKSK
jgi:SNF2 family DNA or RNA helicase